MESSATWCSRSEVGPAPATTACSSAWAGDQGARSSAHRRSATPSIGLSFSAGVLDNEGVFLLRPSWLIDPYWALEGFAGLSPRGEKDIFLGGLGFVLRLAPGAVIGPYAGISTGALPTSGPKVRQLRRQERDPDGARRGRRGRDHVQEDDSTLRIDARKLSLFNENHASNGQEYSGGLAIFF